MPKDLKRVETAIYLLKESLSSLKIPPESWAIIRQLLKDLYLTGFDDARQR